MPCYGKLFHKELFNNVVLWYEESEVFSVDALYGKLRKMMAVAITAAQRADAKAKQLRRNFCKYCFNLLISFIHL